MTYIPAEGETLTVQLPNEAIRATITRVIDKNTIEAALNLAHPFTRLHGYGFNDRARFRRTSASLGGETWVVMDKPEKKYPSETGPAPRLAPPDVHDMPPQKTAPKQKAKRRSDIDAAPRGKARA